MNHSLNFCLKLIAMEDVKVLRGRAWSTIGMSLEADNRPKAFSLAIPIVNQSKRYVESSAELGVAFYGRSGSGFPGPRGDHNGDGR